MSITTKNMTVRGQTTVGPMPLLDAYPNAAAAYSLRKLRTGYTGSAVRVRRSSDNTEQDIGFDANGYFNESDFINFIGYQNLIKYSSQFDNAYWQLRNGTLSTNTTDTLDPDGGNNSEKYIENTSAGFHGVNMNNTETSVFFGTIYTASVYAKSNGRHIVLQVNLTGGSSWGVGYYLFDIVSGSYKTLGIDPSYPSFENISASVSNAGNGWYRCSATFKLSATQTAIQLYFFGSTTNNTTYTSAPSYTGDNSSGFYIYGAQLNTGYIEPYTQTTSTAVDNTGYITKWYDQSLNGRDISQSTAGNQPRLLNRMVVQNYKPAVFFDGNDKLNTSTNILNTSPVTFISAFDGIVKNLDILGNRGSSNGGWVYRALTSMINIGVAANTITSSNTSKHICFGLRNSSAANTFWINSTNQSTTSSPAGYVATSPSSGIFSLGSDGNTGTYGNGHIQEFIGRESDLSTNRTAIESNINKYYQVY